MNAPPPRKRARVARRTRPVSAWSMRNRRVADGRGGSWPSAFVAAEALGVHYWDVHAAVNQGILMYIM